MARIDPATLARRLAPPIATAGVGRPHQSAFGAHETDNRGAGALQPLAQGVRSNFKDHCGLAALQLENLTEVVGQPMGPI
jgi:hypothetical protein